MLSNFQHAVIARNSLDFDPDTELGYDLQMAKFDLPLSALLQRLLLRAVRSLLLMRSLTDATIQVWSCISVRVAQTKPNCTEKSIKETACLPFKQRFYC